MPNLYGSRSRMPNMRAYHTAHAYSHSEYGRSAARSEKVGSSTTNLCLSDNYGNYDRVRDRQGTHGTYLFLFVPFCVLLTPRCGVHVAGVHTTGDLLVQRKALLQK